MAETLTKDQILDGIASLSVLELSELLKEFEERFGVTAAAPVAVAAAPAAGGGEAGGGDEEQTEFDVILARPATRRSRSSRRSAPHQPRPEGGQGPGRQRPQAGAREGEQGRRREGQGCPRGRRGHGRAQVVPVAAPGATPPAEAQVLDGPGRCPYPGCALGPPPPGRSEPARPRGCVPARLRLGCRVAVHVIVASPAIPAEWRAPRPPLGPGPGPLSTRLQCPKCPRSTCPRPNYREE